MMSVKANRVADFDSAKNPGDFFLAPPNPAESGTRRLYFLCPCGCGDLAGIRVRDDGQKIYGAWSWNRNADCPDCDPSIDIKDGPAGSGSHWHGYLRDGEFVPC